MARKKSNRTRVTTGGRVDMSKGGRVVKAVGGRMPPKGLRPNPEIDPPRNVVPPKGQSIGDGSLPVRKPNEPKPQPKPQPKLQPKPRPKPVVIPPKPKPKPVVIPKPKVDPDFILNDSVEFTREVLSEPGGLDRTGLRERYDTGDYGPLAAILEEQSTPIVTYTPPVVNTPISVGSRFLNPISDTTTVSGRATALNSGRSPLTEEPNLFNERIVTSQKRFLKDRF